MARALGVPSNLASLVKTTFERALSAGDVHWFPSKVAIVTVNSAPFQLRFSPALASKPQPAPAPQDAPSSPSSSASTPRNPPDPFANPPPALYIADVGPRHYLVLNKFAVVPEHFILATKEFQPQSELLEAADLEATLACVEAFGTTTHEPGREEDEDEDGLFAFFNSGEHSGASQPHRHIQLLPTARMRDGLPAPSASSWAVLADGEHLGRMPFAAFWAPVTPGMSGADLHGAYLRLHRQACEAVGAAAAAAAPPSRISYNMAMTAAWLAVRQDPRCLEDALRAVGVPLDGDPSRRAGVDGYAGCLAARG
ncbi:5',5'''-P-1,P-4-tetraphosphate phosphorylase 2 [Metarhizium album ARSEF 1941]|uniref:5',5'''-P-1,P-4-tetraphosphate phosphorylase 2 n=1 Tax=Metarhizium album (strain ARSEF 1941) TaxID=1081103 RepID=A0A0B2WST1_METAS|nr:5',5'''-P-1,P-4-tetraphosphate phosphorylase 2 [Metarhizium album ARSEF 1941]KHN97093.1 5',5'''-P-1,P-4-tetraphosphate phosphorylase 2 [Metarhizium album ARSEF 1941]